jgi:hypothetical protein
MFVIVTVYAAVKSTVGNISWLDAGRNHVMCWTVDQVDHG